MRVIKLLCLTLLALAIASGAFFWLRDEPPSAEVQAWLQQAQARPAQSAAYLFLAGLDAPPRHSPAALGESRLRAYQGWLAEHGPAQGFTPAPQAQLALPAGAAFCTIEASACFASLRQRQQELPALLAEHAALLARYRHFLRLNDYRTLSSPGMAEPMPPLPYLMRGQQLLSLQALQQALSGNGPAALALLAEDQAGLRRQLARADHLVLKMGLVSMLNRNLEWQVRLYRQGWLPRPAPIAPLSQAERSLVAAMQREFLLGKVMLENLREDDIPALLEEASLLFEYKPQMTINASLGLYQAIGQGSEVTPAGFAQLLKLGSGPQVPYTGLRNRIGNILLSIANPDFVDFVGRVMDLDSKIKLASLSFQLAPGLVGTEQLAALADAGNPYEAAQRPFLDKQGRLCFEGPLPQKDFGRCVQL